MSDGLSFDLSLDYPGFSLRAAADLPGHGITALVGPSGSGKTTLLQAIAGLEPARGRVTLDGRALHPLPAHRRKVGVVFQNARLFGHLDVAGNIAFGARRSGTPPATVEHIVSALGLAPLRGRAVTRLSGGETRRVALARALAASPDLLLLDEPLSGLDRDSRAEILPYLARAIRAAGCPALFVTHDRDEALSLADRQLEIGAGRTMGALNDPPCLPLEAVAGDGHLLRLGHLTVEMPHGTGPGEDWALILEPARTILATGPNRICDAISLPATVTATTAEGVILSVEGQSVDWKAPCLGLKVGDHCVLLTKAPLFRLISVDADSAHRQAFGDQ